MLKKIVCRSRSLRRLFSSSPAICNDNKPDINEAVNACNLAKGMTAAKASKLFQHALQMSPYEPYVLMEYGKFLFQNGDILAANELFSKANVLSPNKDDIEDYVKTTNNIMNQSILKRVNEVRKKKEVWKSSSVSKAEEELFHSFCYHSILLEGIAVDPENISKMKKACQVAEEYLKLNQFSTEMLLKVHRNIFGLNDLEAGKFRNEPVFINGNATTDVALLDAQIDDLVAWCKNAEKSSINEFELASTVHLKFVVVHPFLDGNGRTARILLASILRLHGYPFIVIPKTEINEYYQAIVNGSCNNGMSFTVYILNCMNRVLDHLIASTNSQS